MAKTYVHMSGRDTEETLLRLHCIGASEQKTITPCGSESAHDVTHIVQLQQASAQRVATRSRQ